MAYGKLKVDTLTWDNAGTDTDISISGIPTAADLAAKASTSAEQTFTAGQRGEITELAAGTSFTIDLDASNNFLIQPNGTYTVALSNISGAKGQCGSIFIKPTAAAASGSFPTTMKFVGGAAGITLTGTSGSIDRIDYIVQDDSAGYECLTCNFTANYVA